MRNQSYWHFFCSILFAIDILLQDLSLLQNYKKERNDLRKSIRGCSNGL